MESKVNLFDKAKYRNSVTVLFVLKLLAECYGAPYEKVWESNEDLWKDMKNRHFLEVNAFDFIF